MRRTLPFLVISLLCAGQALVAAELECPAEIQSSTAHVVLTTYYGHSVGGVLYNDIENRWVTDGPGIVYASAEGHPIGHTWAIDEQTIAECGQTPNAILFDGFESGDLSGWQ